MPVFETVIAEAVVEPAAQTMVPVPFAFNVTLPPEQRVVEEALRFKLGVLPPSTSIVLLMADPQEFVSVAVMVAGVLMDIVGVDAPVLQDKVPVLPLVVSETLWPLQIKVFDALIVKDGAVTELTVAL